MFYTLNYGSKISQFENLSPAGFVIPNPAKSGSGRIGKNKSGTALLIYMLQMHGTSSAQNTSKLTQQFVSLIGSHDKYTDSKP